MFCPRCGQQQASDAVRFCSRCGFRLEVVSGLLSTGGEPLALAPGAEPAHESPRRKGARAGGKLLLSGAFLFFALGLLSEMIRTPVELVIVGLIVFIAGLSRLLYALIFEEGPYRRKAQPTHAPPAQLAPHHEAAALPPQQSVPARGYVPPRAETAELAHRPSVTEGTTRLLDRQSDEPPRQ